MHSARLQAGTLRPSTCSPEGERYAVTGHAVTGHVVTVTLKCCKHVPGGIKVLPFRYCSRIEAFPGCAKRRAARFGFRAAGICKFEEDL